VIARRISVPLIDKEDVELFKKIMGPAYHHLRSRILATALVYAKRITNYAKAMVIDMADKGLIATMDEKIEPLEDGFRITIEVHIEAINGIALSEKLMKLQKIINYYNKSIRYYDTEYNNQPENAIATEAIVSKLNEESKGADSIGPPTLLKFIERSKVNKKGRLEVEYKSPDQDNANPSEGKEIKAEVE